MNQKEIIEELCKLWEYKIRRNREQVRQAPNMEIKVYLTARGDTVKQCLEELRDMLTLNPRSKRIRKYVDNMLEGAQI